MHEQIAALSASASTALVHAMTADGFDALRDRLAELLGRGDRDGGRRAAGELERSCGAIAAAPDTDKPAARAGAEALWRERLRRWLEDNPALAGDLQSLLAESAVGGDGRSPVGGPAFPDLAQTGGADARVDRLTS
ncbi:hypothetical protein [Streptomonospora litoralis]|uniref:Uncharacterized protein n=1 Tax=Streptomonospora litoralis TaxID=2498135 RepID=A0A4P6PWB7_9ACTN|nr:hypothetical protein [Streptomonospora litoralis]QBI52516.1 hypothetical protein EKD16_03525 [Streptomonospora litoralis]